MKKDNKELVKLRKAIQTTKTEGEYIEAKVGQNVLFWAGIGDKSLNKVEELLDVLLYLQRKKSPGMSYESELYVREYQQMFINTIMECQQHVEQKKKPKEKVIKRDYSKMI